MQAHTREDCIYECMQDYFISSYESLENYLFFTGAYLFYVASEYPTFERTILIVCQKIRFSCQNYFV